MNIIPANTSTPCFAYDLNSLRKKISSVQNAFESYENFELFYAVKANSNKKILKEATKNGLGLHVSTAEELKLALSLRCKKISFTSPIITSEIIKLKKIHDFEININNKSDFKLLPKKITRLGLRINPLIGWSERSDAKAGGKYSQFGIPINELDSKIIRKVSSLHCHTSSDSFKQTIFIKQLKELLKIAKNNKNITSINIGGGIGVPIWENEKEFEIEKFSNKIIKILNDFNKLNSTSLLFRLELGNYLIREAGAYICEVVQIEKKSGKTFIFTNGTKHHIRGLNPDSATFKTKSNKMQTATIVGCTCQRGDILLENNKIPALKVKDLIIFANAGAYCSAQADNFHLIPKPTEYFDFNNKIQD